ncbi:MAG: hypothetical protein PHG95_02335 [Patescibacteria group bacterium]|nr:hypothetical protein [Patescibacteria group bacterium]
MKKIFFSALIFSLLFVGWSVRDGKTKDQSYYAGDAVLYKGQLIIATANTGKLEVFSSSGTKIQRLMSVSLSPNPGKEDAFNDVKLEVQGQNLKAYAVAGYALYLYDLSDLQTASLENKVKNTYWEWYYRVDRFGNNIATVSGRGVRIWNNDLQIVDGFDFESELPYSLRSSGDARFLFALNNSALNIYDRENRSIIKTISLDYRDFQKNGRKSYYDRISGNIFVADDYYVKKFDFNGKLLASFRHYGDASYDVESSFDNNFLYFSNGLNVYKLKKSDLSLVKEVQATTLGAPQGWAMGLKLVNTAEGDRLIVFNNSGLLVLDSNLNVISKSDKISQDDGQLYPLENLYLVLGNRSAQSGASVNLQGGGFWPNESLSISLLGSKMNAQADRFGRFNVNVSVPSVANDSRYDIKVDGLSSQLTYSISLEIKK